MQEIKYSIVKLPHGYFKGGIYETDYAPTIDTEVGNWHTLIGEIKMEGIKNCDCVGMLKGGKWDNCIDSARRVYSAEQASPTLTTCAGGNQEVKIVEPKCVGGIGNKQWGKQHHQGDRVYSSEEVACALMAQPIGHTGGNSYLYEVNEPIALDEQNGYLRKDGTVGTIVTDGSSPKHNNRIVEPMSYVERAIQDSNGVDCGFYSEQSPTYGYRKPLDGRARAIKADQHDSCVINNYRIRKLTPRECFRLMGVKDEDFERVAKNQSKSSLYHLAGDSIITNCLMAIFKEML